jgi:hypothetical protein
MINREKNMSELYERMAKCTFSELLLVQAQLSDHILQCWQHHQIELEKKRAEEEPRPN